MAQWGKGTSNGSFIRDVVTRMSSRYLIGHNQYNTGAFQKIGLSGTNLGISKEFSNAVPYSAVLNGNDIFVACRAVSSGSFSAVSSVMKIDLNDEITTFVNLVNSNSLGVSPNAKMVLRGDTLAIPMQSAGSGSRGKLYLVDTITKAITDLQVSNDDTDIAGLALGGTSIYVVAGKRLYHVSYNNTISQIGTLTIEGVALAYYDNHLYIAHSNGKITKFNILTSAIVTSNDTWTEQASTIAVSNSSVIIAGHYGRYAVFKHDLSLIERNEWIAGANQNNKASRVVYTTNNRALIVGGLGEYTYVDFNANTNPTNTTIPIQSTQLGANKTVNLSSYFSDPDGDTLTFTALSSNTTVGTVTVSGSTLTLRPEALGSTTITVTANDGKGGTKSTTFTFSVVNSMPVVTLTGPTNNMTLYEGDAMTIFGDANDTNNGDVVTVRYQVNALAPVAILPFVADGAAKVFSRELSFRAGKLYDGDVLIADSLAAGVAHTLRVYAVDDKGGQSAIAERIFYVVPNRAPLLTIDPITITGNIDSDEVNVAGTFSDPDNNQATVSYRINGANPVQVAQGASGNFDFKFKFSQLQTGLNNIVVEVVDSYSAKTSKTIKLTKNEVKVEQLKSTARYKIKPPLGTAKGVVLWVQRDEGLTLSAKISMMQNGEAENFVVMTKTNTAPMPAQSGIVEDQFQYENATAVDTVILQLDLERSSLTANEKIHTIVGVID